MTPNSHKGFPLTRAALLKLVPGLAVSEALFATSTDSIFCIKNRSLQYISVNEAFLRRGRLSDRQAVLGRTAGELFPPRLAAGYEQQDAIVFATGRPLRNKLEMVSHLDGVTGWCLTQKHPVTDATGRVVAIASVSADLGSDTTHHPQYPALARALEKIQQDFDQPLRIETIAGTVGMSLSQFERRTRALLRISPRQLLTRTRVESAAKLLRESDLPLRSIALRGGFYDQAQFCRQFRSVTGLSPGRYRTATGDPTASP